METQTLKKSDFVNYEIKKESSKTCILNKNKNQKNNLESMSEAVSYTHLTLPTICSV